MKTILLARLRLVDHYKNEPLNHILDSYYYLLERWIIQNDYDYRFFNLSIGARKRKRNYDDWKDSDVIIIPSEQEFRWGEHMAAYAQYKRTNEWIKQIKDKLNDGKKRKVIILSSDKLDNIELYKGIFQLPNLEYTLIDENDFPLGIHSLKYHFIKQIYQDKEKIDDFVYWGSKKDDGRHEIIKEIKNKITSQLYGYTQFKSSNKWLSMKELVPLLSRGKFTLCFNTTPNGFTSRYNESLAHKIIPFVWKDYDTNKDIVSDEFLRVQSVGEYIDKINYIEPYREEYIEELIQQYELKQCTPNQMYTLFDNKLRKEI